jgi:hypothetical protein
LPPRVAPAEAFTNDAAINNSYRFLFNKTIGWQASSANFKNKYQ